METNAASTRKIAITSSQGITYEIEYFEGRDDCWSYRHRGQQVALGGDLAAIMAQIAVEIAGNEF